MNEIANVVDMWSNHEAIDRLLHLVVDMPKRIDEEQQLEVWGMYLVPIGSIWRQRH